MRNYYQTEFIRKKLEKRQNKIDDLKVFIFIAFSLLFVFFVVGTIDMGTL